jgi:hypothetical protein
MQILSDYSGRYIYWRSGSGIGGTPVWSPWVKLKGQNFVGVNAAYTAKPNEAVIQYGAFDVTLPGATAADGDEVSVCFTGSTTNYLKRDSASDFLGGNGMLLQQDMQIDKTWTWVTVRKVGQYWAIV